MVTEPVADGVRSLVVINAPDAPTRFDYELGSPSGISAKPLSDGSFALEQAGEVCLSTTVGRIESPWARDANGVDVPTRIELNNGVLTQVVDHQGAAYPVTADPKLTYGLGVYLNLWGEEATAIQY